MKDRYRVLIHRNADDPDEATSNTLGNAMSYAERAAEKAGGVYWEIIDDKTASVVASSHNKKKKRR